MSKELIELIGTCIVVVAQIYMIDGHDFPFLAWAWDVIARLTGQLANLLGFASLHARANYYTVVNSYGI